MSHLRGGNKNHFHDSFLPEGQTFKVRKLYLKDITDLKM